MSPSDDSLSRHDDGLLAEAWGAVALAEIAEESNADLETGIRNIALADDPASRHGDHLLGEIWAATHLAPPQYCSYCKAPLGPGGGVFFVHERKGDVGPLCEKCAQDEAAWYGDSSEGAMDRWMEAWDELFAVTLVPFGEWWLRTSAHLIEKYRRWRKRA